MTTIMDLIPTIDMRNIRKAIMVNAIAVVVGALVWADNAMASSMDTALYELIDRINANPPTNHKMVEKLMGIKLTLVKDDGFRYYEGHNVPIGDTYVDFIDFREPPSNETITGPFLAFTFADGCISRTETLSRYGELKLWGAPSGHASDEQMYYYQKMPWGRLWFGFLESSPDCLKSIRVQQNPL